MTTMKDLPNLVLDLHGNAGRIIDLLKKSLRALDAIASDTMTDEIKDQKAATKKLFGSFDMDLSPSLETMAKPKTTQDAALKAAKTAILAYETLIRKAPDETGQLALLTSKLSTLLQQVNKVIADPDALSLRKKPLAENWPKTKRDVEKAAYQELDDLIKLYKKDTQRYIDTRKALGTVFSAKTVELIGILAKLKQETAIDTCKKISPALSKLASDISKEKLLSFEMSTVNVEKTINGIREYTVFTRDGVRRIADIAG